MTQKPLSPTNFGELFWRPVRLWPDKVAIEQNDLSMTYSQLEERTRRAAHLLSQLGVRKGDKVALLMSNDYRFAECLFGTLRTGAIAVPLNIKLGVDALVYIAEHSESKILMATADLADKANAVKTAATGLKHMLVVGTGGSGEQDYESRLSQNASEYETVDVELEDVAMLMYTSGSTGRPKGCLLSHKSKWFTAESGARTMLHEPTD